MVERVAGIDVHKSMVMVCVRFPGPDGERRSEVAEFDAYTADLLAMRDWLVAHGVTRVGMEATGDYWKPVFYVLEDVMETWVLNARHMHNVPGRKTDVADAEWIARLVEVGLVRPSFVPDKPIREIRDLTRLRRSRIEERSREAQRLDKVLQDAGIKLSSVASDSLGASGRAMLAALVAGSRDPEALAELAKGRLRQKLGLLGRALEGRFSTHHALIVGEILAHLDAIDTSIERISVEIDRLVSPFADARDRLMTIPGVNKINAEAIIGEIGVDMSRFPSAAHLVSWAGMCPGQHQSAGKARHGTARKGDTWLQRALATSAMSAALANNNYLAAQYRRIVAHRGKRRARKAVGHSILVGAWHILSDADTTWVDLGRDYFERRRDPATIGRRKLADLRALGWTVTLEATGAATVIPPAA